MTTLELFKKHRTGEVSKERFLYEVRRDRNLPWITNVTSYDDAVKILKNKGIIKEAAVTPENIHTAPEVDRVNPYFLKKGVEKMLKDDPALVNDTYINVLNKAAKKLAKDPHAFDDDLISNASSAHELDQALQMKPVKKAADHVDDENGMEKIKGQETLKAMSAPTKENKKGKPKGVEVMKDKGVEGSEKIIKEITSYLKKKLSENSLYHEYAVGQSVPTPQGEGIIKEINGGTLTVEGKDGKLYDVQMNVVEQMKKEQNDPQHAEKKLKEDEYDDLEDEVETTLQVGDVVYVTYPNQYQGEQGEIIELSRDGSFVIVEMPNGDTVSMHSSDVELANDSDFDDNFGYDDEDWSDDIVADPDKHPAGFPGMTEARDINDPARVAASARIQAFKQKQAQPKQSLAQLMAQQDADFEIEQEIKALKRERFQLMRDMEQEAEPEGGPIADDYGDRLNQLDQQIADLEAQLKGQGLEEDTIQEANVPNNILEFAKRKDVTALVQKIARWAEKAGKRIVGGTAIGKNYNTLVLDLTYNGGEIHIDCFKKQARVNDQYVDDYESFVYALDPANFEDIDETSYAGKGAIVAFKKDPKYSTLAGQTRVDMEKKLNTGGSVEL
jgi:hypothetical protein